MGEPEQRTCKKCNATKQIVDFQTSGFKRAPGHICKECKAASGREYRAKNIEKIRAKAAIAYSSAAKRLANAKYMATEKGRANRTAAAIRSKAKYPDRNKARAAVHRAIARGQLTPEPCFICGESAYAHHADYSNQLGVTWLCDKHHKEAHALTKNLKRGEQ